MDADPPPEALPPRDAQPPREAALLYVTGPEDDLARIARALVAERLAACCNLSAPHRAIYRWEGAVAEAEERAMLVKTTAAQAEAATARIVALHSYDLPCVLRLPVQQGHRPFLDWIAAETGVECAR